MLAQRVAVGDHEMEFARGWVLEFVFAKLLSSESNKNRAWNPIKPMSVPTNLIVTRGMFSHGPNLEREAVLQRLPVDQHPQRRQLQADTFKESVEGVSHSRNSKKPGEVSRSAVGLQKRLHGR